MGISFARTTRVLIAALPLALVFCTSRTGLPNAEAALPVEQEVVPRLTIDGPAQVTGAIGGGARGTNITPMAFTDTLSFGELSPINTNTVVRIARTCTATTGTGVTEIRLSVPSRTFSDTDMLQYSDVGVGIQNVRRTGGGCAGVVTAAYNNDPSTSFTIGASGRAAYTTSLANIVNPAGITVLKLRTASTVQFDVVFACVPSYYSPGASSFDVTVALNVSSGSPCP